MNHRPGIEELRRLGATATDPKVQEAYRRPLEMSESEVAAVLNRRRELDEQLSALKEPRFSIGRSEVYEQLLNEIINLERQLDPEYDDRQWALSSPEVWGKYHRGE